MTQGYNRRKFISRSAMAAILLAVANKSNAKSSNEKFPSIPGMLGKEELAGDQRLSMANLKKFESLQYGMFIHFGMSTFSGEELDSGKESALTYNPTALDVDQWVQVIRDSGMKYAVLTTKHVAGHCLWPSKYTDYHVGTSGNKTDVVEAFVKACDKYGIMPGFYYCSWDNHHLFGSKTPSFSLNWDDSYTTLKYREFQMNQIEELLTQYGKIGEMWVDIPVVLGHEGRQIQYDQIASLQPETMIMMNHGCTNGTKMDINYAWPTDLMAIERYLPTSDHGYKPWFEIDGKNYYIPAEVCDPIGYEWFWKENDTLRSVNELLGMRLICKERGANLLLDVPPDQTGQIPKATVDRLIELEKKYAQAI